MNRMIYVFALIMGVTLTGSAVAAEDGQEPGIWQARSVQITYMGITSHYSCDGLEGKLQLLLGLAGVGPHARVRASCSNPMGGPSRITSARLTFNALAPADSIKVAPAAAAQGMVTEQAVSVPGIWKRVTISERTPFGIQAGDCELIEQFIREILPLMAVRNVDSDMRCVPHQETIGGIHLTFEVFTTPSVPKIVKPGRAPAH
jgi:hypothetical protein